MKTYGVPISTCLPCVALGLLFIMILQTPPLKSSAHLGRLVFTDYPKPDGKFTIAVFDLDTFQRSSLPIEPYQDVGIKSVIDKQHVYIRMCLATNAAFNGCSAYVGEIVAPKDVQRFENIKKFWREKYSSPVWSPDGTHIAFSLMINSTFKENPAAFSNDIYVMDAEGRQMLDLTPNDNVYEFTWSPNSQQLAFTCNWNQNLCIANIDGSHVQKLIVPDGITVQQPAWSPDGSEIVFSLVAKDSQSAALYLVNADGSNMHRLSEAESAFHKEPVWSPDSSKISFVSDTNADQEIYVINRDGSDLLDLSQDLNGIEAGAVWSPDSHNVAFFSDQGKESNLLYIADANQGHAQKITDGSLFVIQAPDLFWIP